MYLGYQGKLKLVKHIKYPEIRKAKSLISFCRIKIYNKDLKVKC